MNQDAGQWLYHQFLSAYSRERHVSGEGVVWLITRIGTVEQKIMAGGFGSDKNDKLVYRVRGKKREVIQGH